MFTRRASLSALAACACSLALFVSSCAVAHRTTGARRSASAGGAQPVEHAGRRSGAHGSEHPIRDLVASS